MIQHALAALTSAPTAPLIPRSAIVGRQTLADAESVAAANHRRFDLDGDGYVTRAEVAEMLRKATDRAPVPGVDAAHPLPPASEAIFAATDTDHDGRISEAENIAAVRRSFAAMDADHDGVVTPDERWAFLKAGLAAGHLPFGVPLPHHD